MQVLEWVHLKGRKVVESRFTKVNKDLLFPYLEHLSCLP